MGSQFIKVNITEEFKKEKNSDRLYIKKQCSLDGTRQKTKPKTKADVEKKKLTRATNQEPSTPNRPRRCFKSVSK